MHSVMTTILESFNHNRNASKAPEMQKYMKDHFPFLGIASPERRLLLKPACQAAKSLSEAELLQLFSQLYQQNEREFHYAAIDIFASQVKRLPNDWQAIAGYLPYIDANSWWDSVDALRKPISDWTKYNKEQLPMMMEYLLGSESFWLRRVAITLQLQWKQQTDTVWLAKAITSNLSDPEFFIQKAIGWALRELSKTDPKWVSAFIHKHKQQLSSLAIKEASKYLPC